MAIISNKCQFPNCEKERDLKRRSSLCAMHRTKRSRHQMTEEENRIFSEIKRVTKSKGKICSVTNCNGRSYKHGNVCSKHRWRFKKYGQYDLPGHQGESNILKLPKLPEGKVTRCKIHGDLSKDQTYVRYHKGKESSFYCRECILSINIKNKYKGMDGLDDYEKMLVEQNGVCKICKGKNNTTRNGKVKRYNIDHCHKTNKVRGLLCSFCNSLIGYAQDSIPILQSAIEYLKFHDDK